MFTSIWNYEVRLAPLLLGLSIFSVVHLIRKLSKIEYTPSYFAIFALSLLDHQLSLYFGEFYGGEYFSIEKGRKRNSSLFAKSVLSFFITFFLVPLLIGVVISFLILPNELPAFLFLLLLWQAINCTKAVFDFSTYRGERKANMWLFFGSFYASYLLALFFVIRLAYRFAQPFVSKGDVAGLLGSLEDRVVSFVVSIVIVGVAGGLFTHWFINKDAIQPQEQGQYGIPSPEREESDEDQ